MTLITGNTYPVKDRLHALGGRWLQARRGWEVPEAVAEEARQLVASAGPVRSRPRTDRYGSALTIFSGGGEVYTNRSGRCEDAPCCGCCS